MMNINFALATIRCLSVLPFICQAANILLLEGVPSPSHHIWISKVSYALAAKGHNVTSISANIEETRSTPNLHYFHLDRVNEHFNDPAHNLNFIEYGRNNAWQQMLAFQDYSLLVCEGITMSKGWKQLHAYPDSFKFDLVIHDFLSGHCLLPFLVKFRYPPMIGLTAFNDPTIPAGMINTIMVPSISTNFNFKKLKLHFLDRVENYAIKLADYALRHFRLNRKIDEIIRTKGGLGYRNIPAGNELNRLHKLMLINYDVAIDTAEQFPVNIIGVGGLQIQPARPLPDDLLAVIGHSESGLIVFSLGTNVPIDHVGIERFTSLLAAFKQFPDYTFLCKCVLTAEFDNIALPENVIVREWLPQNDVLANPRVKLFITHSGLLSTQEAVWHAVPMLGVPVFVDQFLNIEKSIRKGIAEKVLWDDFTTATLVCKLSKMLNDPSYAENMKLVSDLFRDQKEAPLDRAVWWIEWMQRHPNATHLQSVGFEFNLIQLQSIDVLAFIFVLILLCLWTVKILICFLIRLAGSLIVPSATKVVKGKKNKVA